MSTSGVSLIGCHNIKCTVTDQLSEVLVSVLSGTLAATPASQAYDDQSTNTESFEPEAPNLNIVPFEAASVRFRLQRFGDRLEKTLSIDFKQQS